MERDFFFPRCLVASVLAHALRKETAIVNAWFQNDCDASLITRSANYAHAQ